MSASARVSGSSRLRIDLRARSRKAPNRLRSSAISLWSRLTLVSTATSGLYRPIEPSLSSTSLTNSSGSPTKALANGAEGVAKFFITAPFITVGWRWQAWRIQPIIPVTVDFPLMPQKKVESFIGGALLDAGRHDKWGKDEDRGGRSEQHFEARGGGGCDGL